MIYEVKFINVANLMITLCLKVRYKSYDLVHYPFQKSEGEKQDRRKYDEKKSSRVLSLFNKRAPGRLVMIELRRIKWQKKLA